MDSTLFELLKTTQDVNLRETLENKIKHLEKISYIQDILTNMIDQINMDFIEPKSDFEPDYFDNILTNTKTKLEIYFSQEDLNFFELVYNQFVLDYKNLCAEYVGDYTQCYSGLIIDPFSNRYEPTLKKELFNINYCIGLIDAKLPKNTSNWNQLTINMYRFRGIIITNIHAINAKYHTKLQKLLYEFRIGLVGCVKNLY